MDYSQVELYCVATATAYPDQLDRLRIELLSNEDMQNMYKMVKESDKTLSYYLMHHKRFDILKTKLDLIWNESLKLQKQDKTIVLKEYQKAIEKLNEREKREKMVLQLQAAIELLERGDTVSAISIAKSLEFEVTDNVTNIWAQMVMFQNIETALYSGIESLDEGIKGFKRGNIVHLGGDTGSMKTRISLWLMIKFLLRNPEITGLYFEKEMVAHDVSKILATDFLGIEEKKFEDDGMSLIEQIAQIREKKPELSSALERLNIISHTEFDTAIDLYKYIDTYKPAIWCLDFLQMLGDNAEHKDEMQYVWEQSKNLKTLANNTNTLGIVLSQFKQNATVDSNKIGTKASMEYGSRMNQYSAYIFTTFFPSLYYTDDYVPSDYFYLIMHKNRHGRSRLKGGLPLFVPIIARPSESVFMEAAKEDRMAMKKWLEGYYAKNR